MQTWTQSKGSLYLYGNTFEESGWYIKVTFGGIEIIELWEIPLYGGEPQKYGEFNKLENAIAKGESLK